MENFQQNTLTVRMSARYHSLCERWYRKLNKVTLFVNLFSGSAVVGTVLTRNQPLAIASGLAVTLVTALDITFGTAEKAALHRDLYRRYLLLDAAIAKDGLDEKSIIEKTREIELDEPPIIEVFRIYAYRANLETHRYEPSVELSWLQRIMMALV